jgi:hypothetical protein
VPPPGTHGGNLDLRELAEGSTLYLPVWQRGGLIYTGDSHAVQGDGRRHRPRRARDDPEKPVHRRAARAGRRGIALTRHSRESAAKAGTQEPGPRQLPWASAFAGVTIILQEGTNEA